MDFTLSKQQAMVQKMYKEFAENEVKPLAKKVDAEEYFPKETVEKMAKLGMMGIYFPKEVGGAGGDVLSYVMAVEEMSKVCGTTGVILSAHTSLCAAPIYENGTADQKAKYLPKLCSGEWLGAFGLTEPGAGTDAQGQQTFAVDEGDHWKLNGSKIFITNAGYADVFIIIAVTGFVTDKRGRKQKEISAFIVERTDPGFKVGKPEDKMGIRGSSTCELIMEDCIIPKDRLLGVKGKGFQLAMATLDGGRIGIAAQALGIAEGAIDETVAYVKERKQFGRSIAQFQNTQFELAEMKARVEAAKYLVYAAALKKQQAMDGAKVPPKHGHTVCWLPAKAAAPPPRACARRGLPPPRWQVRWKRSTPRRTAAMTQSWKPLLRWWTAATAKSWPSAAVTLWWPRCSAAALPTPSSKKPSAGWRRKGRGSRREMFSFDTKREPEKCTLCGESYCLPAAGRDAPLGQR